jgi:hypothetical protein
VAVDGVKPARAHPVTSRNIEAEAGEEPRRDSAALIEEVGHLDLVTHPAAAMSRGKLWEERRVRA